ncbi:MAG: glycosyltransferase family 4 protein [Anaerohalosphaeraceae bacterium]|nr:glycosyltransferase family 4 protein [Anaerohalosphaeraceae bacterium]
MKIAIITERANITLGGAERSVFELAARLGLMGVTVEIFAATGTSHSHRVKILCDKAGQKRADFSTFKRALTKHFAENHYDIIHSTLPIEFADVYQPRGGTYPESIIRNAKSFENPIISACKVITSFLNFRRAALAAAEKRICKPSGKPIVAALSEYVKKQLKKHYALADEKIVVIPNGVKTPKPARQDQADKLRAQILAKLKLKEADEPVFFLFAANNFRLKGLASVIKAMWVLGKMHTKRPAYIIVAGRDRPGPYRHLAKTMKVSKKIIFLGQTPNINTALTVCDVAVLPTYYDPSSRFILEALAAGKPVITTKYNGACDMFCNDRHGKIFDSPGDIDSLAQAMKFYTDTKTIEDTTQAIAQDNIKEKVSIESHCRELLKLYEQILENRTQQ